LKEPELTHGQPYCFVVDSYKLNLPALSRELWDWMPAGRERLLLVSDWSHYPPDQPTIFNTIRKGCGVHQSLPDAPGHLFVSTKDDNTDYDNRPLIDVEEESIASWLAGLMLEWTWQGYMTVQGYPNAVRLGDGFVRFLSTDPVRLAAGTAICAKWGLRPCARYPWQ